jgi:hypothetical protein
LALSQIWPGKLSSDPEDMGVKLIGSNGNANGIMDLDGSINAVGKYYLSL